MIYLVTGTPGSFKTLSTIGRVIEFAAESAKQGMARTVYAANINNMNVPDWETLDHGYNWPDLPDGSIVVIDECQKEEQGFGRMSTTAKVPKHISDLEDHRHRGFDIFLITQGPHLINSHIKPLIDTHWHYLRKYGWDKAHVYTSTGIIKNPETKSNLKDLEHSTYKPDKSLYQYYDSATLHTVKKRMPKAIKWGVPALFFLLFLIWNGIKTVKGLADNPEPVPQQTDSSVVVPDMPIQHASSEPDQSSFDPMVAYKPRIAAMPETAPAYDDLRKPQDFPRPQCLASPNFSRCDCYSQQGTLMHDYPHELCVLFVKHGYFDPTKPRVGQIQNNNRDQRSADFS